MTKLLLFLAFLSGTIVSQNYHPIDPSREAWFEYDTPYGPRIHTVKIDSVRNVGGDTSYYNYKIFGILTTAGNCIGQKDSNFFMDNMLIKQNGNHFFFTKNNDSILLKPFSFINNSWILFRYQNGDHIDATVSSIVQQSIFGSPDSVKIISLQAKNASNTPISNDFNGKKILIAKNNGLLRFYNTLDFPADTSSFDLIGKSNLPQGVTNLTSAQIYNWSVGDKFQFTGGHNAAPGGASAVKEQFIIIGKNISLNNDTITYTKDWIYCQTNYQFNPFDSTKYYTHDTIIQKVIISEKAPLDYYPYESINNVNSVYGYLFQFNDNQYFGRMKKTLDAGFSYSPMDSCINRTIGWCVFPVYTYVSGIGLASQDNGGLTCFHKNLVYYEKGSEIWGNPIVMCSGLTGIESYGQKENNIIVSPNPGNGKFTINAKSAVINAIEIYNVIGEKVFSENRYQQGVSSKYQIDLTGQPKGMYYLSISVSGKNAVRKIILQ